MLHLLELRRPVQRHHHVAGLGGAVRPPLCRDERDDRVIELRQRSAVRQTAASQQAEGVTAWAKR